MPFFHRSGILLALFQLFFGDELSILESGIDHINTAKHIITTSLEDFLQAHIVAPHLLLSADHFLADGHCSNEMVEKGRHLLEQRLDALLIHLKAE